MGVSVSKIAVPGVRAGAIPLYLNNAGLVSNLKMALGIALLSLATDTAMLLRTRAGVRVHGGSSWSDG